MKSRGWQRTVAAALVAWATSLGIGCSESAAPKGTDESGPPDQITDLVGLGGFWALARAINAPGRVVGEASIGGGRSRAFIWTSLGGIRDLGTLGGQSSGATAINDRTQVAGWAATPSEAPHAFLVIVGQMEDLGTPPGGLGSFANDVNDSSTVVGHWVSTAGHTRAFVWTPSAGMRDIGVLSDFAETQATSVNARNEIVGFGWDSSGLRRALIWSPGARARELGALPGDDESVAWAINSDGHVVGASRAGGGPERAFLWSPSTIRDLGVLPGMDWSIARDINDRGTVVGYSGRNGSNVGRAFSWTESAGMRDLGALSAGDSTESAAFGVNWFGKVVGYSWNGSAFRPVIFPRQP